MSHPVFEIDSEAPLLELEKIFARYTGRLSEEKVSALKLELERLVPRGHYLGTDFGVQVIEVGYTEPTATGFYVRFRILCGGETKRLPIALFIETYRLIGIDML